MKPRNNSEKIRGFVGLNNTLPVSTSGIVGEKGNERFLLRNADNVYVGNRNELRTRPGTTVVGSYDSVYASDDEQYFYGIRGGGLYFIFPDLSEYYLYTVGSGPYKWCEVVGLIFLQSSEENVILDGMLVTSWGVPTCASPAIQKITGSLQQGTYMYTCIYEDIATGVLGNPTRILQTTVDNAQGIRFNVPQRIGYRIHIYLSHADNKELYWIASTDSTIYNLYSTPLYGNLLRTLNFYPPPIGDFIAFYANSIYISVKNRFGTRIFISEPNQFHHFDIREMGGRFIDVNGEVRLLHGLPMGLVIGTERSVYLHTLDKELDLIPNSFGVPVHKRSNVYMGRLYFNTFRGLCSVGPSDPPFINHSESQYRSDFGSEVSVNVVEINGTPLMISNILQSGTTYNKLTTEHEPTVKRFRGNSA